MSQLAVGNGGLHSIYPSHHEGFGAWVAGGSCDVRDGMRFIILAAFWWLWSGHTEPLVLFFGFASCALVTWLARRMDAIDGGEPPYTFGLRPLGYLIYLLIEVVKSNLHVARVILDPKLPVSPCLVRVVATQKTDLGRVVFANSITLTPGTLTLDLRDGEVLVHALTQEAADGLLEGHMDARVSSLEGSA